MNPWLMVPEPCSAEGGKPTGNKVKVLSREYGQTVVLLAGATVMSCHLLCQTKLEKHCPVSPGFIKFSDMVKTWTPWLV